VYFLPSYIAPDCSLRQRGQLPSFPVDLCKEEGLIECLFLVQIKDARHSRSELIAVTEELFSVQASELMQPQVVLLAVDDVVEVWDHRCLGILFCFLV
jgi:hypothetical protein